MGKVKDILIERSEGVRTLNTQCIGDYDGECSCSFLNTECLGAMLENKTYTVHILKAHPVSHEKVGGRTVVDYVPNAEGQKTFGCPYYALKVGREYMRRHKLDRARMGKHSSTCPYAVHVREHKETPSVPETE